MKYINQDIVDENRWLYHKNNNVMYHQQLVPSILVTRLVSEIRFIYFLIVLHEETNWCGYYLPFDSNYHYYCDEIHGELLPPSRLLNKDTACMDSTAHWLKSLCIFNPFDGEFLLFWLLYEKRHGIIRSIQQSRRRMSNNNTPVWLLFQWQLRRTKKRWIKTRKTKKRWIETRRTLFYKITPTSNDEEWQFGCYNNCVVDTYATMTPPISIDDTNKDDYDSSDCHINRLWCQSCCLSILINALRRW